MADGAAGLSRAMLQFELKVRESCGRERHPPRGTRQNGPDPNTNANRTAGGETNASGGPEPKAPQSKTKPPPGEEAKQNSGNTNTFTPQVLPSSTVNLLYTVAWLTEGKRVERLSGGR